jgi:hypothetical protein
MGLFRCLSGLACGLASLLARGANAVPASSGRNLIRNRHRRNTSHRFECYVFAPGDFADDHCSCQLCRRCDQDHAGLCISRTLATTPICQVHYFEKRHRCILFIRICIRVTTSLAIIAEFQITSPYARSDALHERKS